MKYINYIINKIKDNTILQRLILIVLIVVFCLLYIRECSNSKKANDINEWNIKALKSETEKVYTKNKQLEFEKNIISTTLENLKLYNDSLNKELEKEKGDVKVIYKIDLTYKIDTVYITKSTYTKKDSNYIINWGFDINENSLQSSIRGNSIFTIDTLNKEYILNNIYSKLLEYTLNLNLVTGVKEVDDNKYKIFVRTKEPNDKIIFNLDGAVLDDNFSSKRKWFVIGPFVGATYTNSFQFTYGIGLSINLFDF